MSEKDDIFAIWKFPYKKGTHNKVIIQCSCGGEFELFDIYRNKKNVGIQLEMPNDYNSTVSITCDSCDTSFTFRQRGYTPGENSELRNDKIDNLLPKK